MRGLREQQKEIEQLVVFQLKNYWIEVNEDVIHSAIPGAISVLEDSFCNSPNPRFFDGEVAVFSPYLSVHWMLFLYRLSHEIYKNNTGAIPKEADQVYYLNKIMHSNDWLYAIDLPTHFLCEHPLGSVLGKAKYGDYLFIYQGTTIGGNRKSGELYYPEIGDNVTLFANSTILGESRIGNNVIISAETYLINEKIPDNCIVFGKTPNINIKKKTEEEIKEYTQHIWGW